MSSDFSAFADHCRARVNAALRARLPHPDPQHPQLTQAMEYSLFNGGKRVRPILVYAAADALNQQARPGLDTIAGSLECIHAYSLAHDDLPAMDDDDLRRGRPSCHIAFTEATAILAGDALQALAFQWLTEETEFDPQLRLNLLNHLAEASGMQGMVLGQAIDLGATNQTLTLEHLERMHHCKTGALIRASVIMAALACNASKSQLAALETYARALGLAFQVQDDILDVTADTQTLGKQQGADVQRNKPTYVSLLGLEGARRKADLLCREAVAAIDTFSDNAAQLRHLADYIVHRGH